MLIDELVLRKKLRFRNIATLVAVKNNLMRSSTCLPVNYEHNCNKPTHNDQHWGTKKIKKIISTNGSRLQSRSKMKLSDVNYRKSIRLSQVDTIQMYI